MFIAIIPTLSAASARAENNLFLNPRFIPLTPREIKDESERLKSDEHRKNTPSLGHALKKTQADRDAARGIEIIADRNAYWNDDGFGQFVAILRWIDSAQPGLKVNLALAGPGGEIGKETVNFGVSEQSPKIAFLVNTDALKPGDYTLNATAIGADGKSFGNPKPLILKREDKSHPKVLIPAEGIPVQVHPQEMATNASWPITTGIPMPFGTLRDVNELQLLENGKPVPAQFTVRSTWTPGQPSFVRWLTLDFVAQYDGMTPREYRLVQKPGLPRSVAIQTTQTDDLITVNNGLVQFQVKRKGFTGIESAWIDANRDGKFTDNEQVISSRAAPTVSGPYIVDDKGLLFRAADDSTAEVKIEEQGPARVTILATGWYFNPTAAEAERKLCQFVTRITAYAGHPNLFISHRTIQTQDTLKRMLADIGFRTGMTGAQRYVTSMDGKVAEGALPAKDSVWIHQERADRVRLVEGETDRGQDHPGKGDQAKVQGKHADGWMSIAGDTGTVTAMIRDIWQRFPKELEADRQGLVVHLWPRHGRETFTHEEQIDKRNCYKAWFAHQGKLLDMHMPKFYHDVLHPGEKPAAWDPEDEVEKAYRCNAQGTVVGGEIVLRLEPAAAKPDSQLAQARLFQLSPHALAAPEWNCRAEVDVPMAPRNDQRLPEVERTINVDFPGGMFNMLDCLGDYGMWIYGNTHNGWRQDMVGLHRVWQITSPAICVAGIFTTCGGAASRKACYPAAGTAARRSTPLA
ncbi:MAG: hypothetical protein HY360_10265 [Verrucomicrobia bacterium]|nr:hypothetical protein [Verrucomicrobiota bacterium]